MLTKIKSRFFVLIIFALSSFSSFGESAIPENLITRNPDLNIVLQRLQKNKLLRSQFTQERRLKILTKPLISKGRLNYFSGKGIVWEIESPIKSILIISQNKITEINFNRKPVSQPNIGGVYTALDALFNGNAGIIDKNFIVNYDGTTKNWRIVLTPKFAPLNKIFKSIEMQGEHQIKRITLNDNNQDSTVITLISIQDNPQAITSAEEVYFAL